MWSDRAAESCGNRWASQHDLRVAWSHVRDVALFLPFGSSKGRQSAAKAGKGRNRKTARFSSSLRSQSFQQVTGTAAEHPGGVALFVPCFAPVFANCAKTTGCSVPTKQNLRNPLSLSRMIQRRKLLNRRSTGARRIFHPASRRARGFLGRLRGHSSRGYMFTCAGAASCVSECGPPRRPGSRPVGSAYI
jgi:hypothetical protein